MKNIRLFWFSEIYLLNKTKENYGDLLGKYLVEKMSNANITFVNPRKINIFNFFKPIYFTIGSILANVKGNAIVWGSGIIQQDAKVNKAKFLAVRGPYTRKRLLELGYDCPPIYGDPAILLPNYFNPTVEKKYKYGVIPHYVDYKAINELVKDPNINVINLMTNNIEEVTKQILECENIISTSLHGIIVPHAYGIPAVWVKFSEKIFGDDIKYKDYFESVGITHYSSKIDSDSFNTESFNLLMSKYQNLPDDKLLQKNKIDLLHSCPFL